MQVNVFADLSPFKSPLFIYLFIFHDDKLFYSKDNEMLKQKLGFLLKDYSTYLRVSWKGIKPVKNQKEEKMLKSFICLLATFHGAETAAHFLAFSPTQIVRDRLLKKEQQLWNVTDEVENCSKWGKVLIMWHRNSSS